MSVSANKQSNIININVLLDENKCVKDAEQHNSISTILVEQAQSGAPLDVMKALRFVEFHPCEGYHRNYSLLLYEKKNGIYYRWSPDVKLWVKVEFKTFNVHPQMKALDSFRGKVEYYRTSINAEIMLMQSKNPNVNVEILEERVKRITRLIGKLKTPSFYNSIWEELLKTITIDLSVYRNPITPYLPLSDGNNYNIFTRDVITRTMKEYYTDCINAVLDRRITDIFPTDESPASHHIVYNFLYQICCEDVSLLLFLLYKLAWYISGDVSDQSFMIFIGDGTNGKSVLISILQALLGEYSHTMGAATMFEFGARVAPNSHTSNIDVLKGKRLGIISEGKERALGWNTELIKKITGGDSMANRRCHDANEEKITLETHLIVMANGSDLPKMKDGHAERRRTLYVPFNAFFYKYEGEKPIGWKPAKFYPINYRLKETLCSQECLNVFLSMLFLAAEKEHQEIPECVTKLTNYYFEQFFVYNDFITEYCVEGDFSEKMTDLLKVYEYTEGKVNKQTFYANMDKKYKRKKKSVWHYAGLKLNDEGRKILSGPDY